MVTIGMHLGYYIILDRVAVKEVTLERLFMEGSIILPLLTTILEFIYLVTVAFDGRVVGGTMRVCVVCPLTPTVYTSQVVFVILTDGEEKG